MEKFLIDLHIQKNIRTAKGNEILDVRLTIPEYNFITLFGKSGVGKTTVLRMIAGLITPDSGFIKVNNQIWFDSSLKINLKPQKRNIGFVFQDYALFPNMTVKEHLLFAQKNQEKDYVSKLLDVFHLKGLCEQKPAKLSGGQQQRLAVARALARKPGILLLDEPLSALDSETRNILQDEILIAHRNFMATTILVSHDVNEVTKLSDFVYVFEEGKIIKKEKIDLFLQKNNKAICRNKNCLQIENNILTFYTNNSTNKIKLTPNEIKSLNISQEVNNTTNTNNAVIKCLSVN